MQLRPDHIPLIHNYCDYWCDRCAFTSRCAVFADKKWEAREARLHTDGDNAALWRSVEGALQESLAQLRELRQQAVADWFGDVSGEPTDEDLVRQARQREAEESHPLTKLAWDYFSQVADWLKTSGDSVRGVADGVLAEAKITRDLQAAETELSRLNDMLEIVSWYHTLFPPKVGRFLSSVVEHDEDDGLPADDYDLLGTAKFLLVSLDRNIVAWMELLKALPEQEDALLGFLVLLARLRSGIDQLVPSARAFLRPGIDEP